MIDGRRFSRGAILDSARAERRHRPPAQGGPADVKGFQDRGSSRRWPSPRARRAGDVRAARRHPHRERAAQRAAASRAATSWRCCSRSGSCPARSRSRMTLQHYLSARRRAADWPTTTTTTSSVQGQSDEEEGDSGSTTRSPAAAASRRAPTRSAPRARPARNADRLGLELREPPGLAAGTRCITFLDAVCRPDGKHWIERAGRGVHRVRRTPSTGCSPRPGPARLRATGSRSSRARHPPRNASTSARSSPPTPPTSSRCGSCSPPTPPARASTCRPTATAW